MRRLAVGFCALALFACDDSSGGGGGDAGALTDGRVISGEDGGAPDSAAGDAGPTADATANPDAETADAEAGDAAVVGIGDCQAACDVYAACEGFEPTFSDEGDCLLRCQQSSRDGAPTNWFDCLDDSVCLTLDSCPPPPPDPLDCAATCAAVDACDAENVPDCLTLCPQLEPDVRQGLLDCANRLEGGLCDTVGFQNCLAERVTPSCGAICEQSVACNLAPADACAQDCVAGAMGTDPLARRLIDRSAECLTTAENCLAINQCITPGAISGLGNTCQQACDDLQGCDLAPDPQQCLTDCERQLEENPTGQQFFIDCIVEYVAAANCAPDAFIECGNLDPPRQPAPCVALCEARVLCGTHPGPIQTCIDSCSNALLDPAGGGEWIVAMPCGRVGTCDEHVACEEAAAPDGACATHCAALAECGEPDEGCVAGCVEDFGQPRLEAARDCTEAAADCDAQRACLPGPPLPCEAFCERSLECGQIENAQAIPGCLQQCETESVNAPATAASRLACVLGAPACQNENPFAPEHSAAACVFDPTAGGAPAAGCLAVCRAETECAGDADGLARCANRCANGLGGEQVLQRTQGAECIAGLPAVPSCDALEACIPAELDYDCGAYCAITADCGIPQEDCAARCAEAPPLDRIGCSTLAVECLDIAACVGFEPPQAEPNCAAACDRQLACGLVEDRLRCETSCPPEGDLTNLVECFAVSGCQELGDCLDTPSDPMPGCLEACAGACEEGAAADCEAVCTGRVSAPRADADLLAQGTACLAAEGAECSAASARACFPVTTDCEITCDLIFECQVDGLFGDVAGCKAFWCAEAVPNPLFESATRCALQHLPGGACNNAAYQMCVAGT